MNLKTSLLLSLATLCLSSCAHVRNNTSLDVGTDVQTQTFSPYIGLSYVPIGNFSISTGLWSSIDGEYGPYFGVGYSWTPFMDGDE